MREAERLGNRLDVRFQQDDICGFAGDITGPGHRDAQVGLLQSGRVVDAVPDNGDAFAAVLQLLHHLRFLFGTDFGKHIFFPYAGLLRYGRGRELVVAGDEVNGFALLRELGDNFVCVRFEGVAQREQADESAFVREAKNRCALGGPMSRKSGNRTCRRIGCPEGSGVFTAPRRAGQGQPDHATFAQPIQRAEAINRAVKRRLHAFAREFLPLLQCRAVTAADVIGEGFPTVTDLRYGLAYRVVRGLGECGGDFFERNRTL